MELLGQMGLAGFGILLDSGFWIVVSLIAAGLVREFVTHGRLRSMMRHRGVGSMFGAMGLGATLPMCSCGVIPLAVSFHVSGMRLGAVMAFAAATPVINPAAVLLSYALLGPQVTLAYVAFGLTMPLAAGWAAERFGTRGFTPVAQALQQGSCCSSQQQPQPQRDPMSLRLQRAFKWGFGELGPTLGLYLAVGIALAAVVMVAVPSEWVPRYLGSSAPFLSLLLIALFGMMIYVCAVAHIPLVAALLAAGASPGVAIVFLVTGAVTNLPEFIALQRVLGTRTVVSYIILLVVTSIFAGWLVNLWLATDYVPVMDPIQSLTWSDRAAAITPVVGGPLAFASAAVVLVLCTWGVMRWVKRVIPGAHSRVAGAA